MGMGMGIGMGIGIGQCCTYTGIGKCIGAYTKVQVNIGIGMDMGMGIGMGISIGQCCTYAGMYRCLYQGISKYYCWESAEILKSIITNLKSIDNKNLIRPIKSLNTGNSSHFIIKKGFLSFTYCTLFACTCLKSMSSGIIIEEKIDTTLIIIFVVIPLWFSVLQLY